MEVPTNMYRAHNKIQDWPDILSYDFFIVANLVKSISGTP